MPPSEMLSFRANIVPSRGILKCKYAGTMCAFSVPGPENTARGEKLQPLPPYFPEGSMENKEASPTFQAPPGNEKQLSRPLVSAEPTGVVANTRGSEACSNLYLFSKRSG